MYFCAYFAGMIEVFWKMLVLMVKEVFGVGVLL
jgi:hypothetical protein